MRQYSLPTDVSIISVQIYSGGNPHLAEAVINLLVCVSAHFAVFGNKISYPDWPLWSPERQMSRDFSPFLFYPIKMVKKKI